MVMNIFQDNLSWNPGMLPVSCIFHNNVNDKTGNIKHGYCKDPMVADAGFLTNACVTL